MFAYGLGNFAIGQVNVASFPSHREQQATLIPIAGQQGQLNTRTVRRKPSYDPAAAKANKGVRTPHRTRDQCLVPDFYWAWISVSPEDRRRDQHLGFSR